MVCFETFTTTNSLLDKTKKKRNKEWLIPRWCLMGCIVCFLTLLHFRKIIWKDFTLHNNIILNNIMIKQYNNNNYYYYIYLYLYMFPYCYNFLLIFLFTRSNYKCFGVHFPLMDTRTRQNTFTLKCIRVYKYKQTKI